MKLSNISIIFIIIMIPIILVLSYYISLQIDTINMQTAYSTKHLEATKEAIEAFEINTVEWNEAYSENADSKRRDIMASINTFTTSFANGIGVGGTNKEYIETYIPAIACTLYDGYYIYTPSETKSVIKDDKGVAVFATEKLAEQKSVISFYFGYKDEYKGKLLYEYDSENKNGITADGEYKGTKFTLNPDGAKTTYEHILKPFSTYSARYKTDDGKIDITVNYTLDNYITIYGNVNGEYVVKSGYLILPRKDLELASETLSEKIAWRWNEEGEYTCKEYPYVYADDNTKVYFDEANGDKTFKVSSTGIRTDLDKTTDVEYKKVRLNSWAVVYQALNTKTIKISEEETKTIVQGQLYSDKNGDAVTELQNTELTGIPLKTDYSVRNYYIESASFTEWVKDYLSGITIDHMQVPDSEKSKYGNLTDEIFNISGIDPENEDSAIVRHKREVIKQTLISNLNQSITSYSRNSEGEYRLPILTETDWDHVLKNVSIITFVQNIPIGMKYYNNYAIATSTENKEYTNPDEIYLASEGDNYYHLPYCSKLKDSGYIKGYRNVDYVEKSYKKADGTQYYYYKHSYMSNEDSYMANEACYYCLVQRELYNSQEDTNKWKNQDKSYKTALARERYRNISAINLEARTLDIKVSLNDNYEGGGEKDIYVALKGKYGEAIGGFEDATREGYNFMGWYTADTGGTQVTANTTVTISDDHTLYAHWSACTYTVSYDGNGADNLNAMSEIRTEVTYDVGAEIAENKFTRSGYDFAGWHVYRTDGKWLYNDSTPNEKSWYTEGNQPSDATKRVWNNGTTTKHASTKQGNNIILYAQWTPNTYTITYDANGGYWPNNAATTYSETVEYDSNLEIKQNWYKKTGYIFKGWNEKPDGTGTDWTSSIDNEYTWKHTKNITLYAIWEELKSPDAVFIETDKTYQYTTVAGDYKVLSDYPYPNGTGISANGKSSMTLNVTFSINEHRTDGKEQMIVATTESSGWGLRINGSKKLDIVIWNKNTGSYEWYGVNTSIEPKRIYNVTTIYDGSKIIMYLKDTVTGTTTKGEKTNIKLILTQNNDIATTLGENPIPKGTIYSGSLKENTSTFNGKIYNARLWYNQVFNEQQINSIYDQAMKDLNNLLNS